MFAIAIDGKKKTRWLADPREPGLDRSWTWRGQTEGAFLFTSKALASAMATVLDEIWGEHNVTIVDSRTDARFKDDDFTTQTPTQE